MNDLKPSPAHVQWWRRTRKSRLSALTTFKSMATRALTLAISFLGATLISYGVYSVYPPAGYVVGGALLWVLQWNYGSERSDG